MTAADVEPRKLGLPKYVAVITWTPRALKDVLTLAVPPTITLVPIIVGPSKNETDPVSPFTFEETEAVKRTLLPRRAGFSDDTRVVVVAAPATKCTADAVALPYVPSPEYATPNV
jgi:hypothetical protein